MRTLFQVVKRERMGKCARNPNLASGSTEDQKVQPQFPTLVGHREGRWLGVPN